MANVKISDIKRALPLAKSLVKKLDVDKDKKVSWDEVKRIRVRDNFVARNLVSNAMDRLSYPDDPGPYEINYVQGALEGAIASLEKADKNKDGTLTPAELAKASKVAKSFVEFAALYKNKSVEVFNVKPYEKPGSAEWVNLAKKEYFGKPNEPMNKPYFGTALLLKRTDLPNAKMKAGWDAMIRDFPSAKVEAISFKVNDAPVYFMHAKTDSRYDVRLFDEKGNQIASGVARPKSDPRADWYVRWD